MTSYLVERYLPGLPEADLRVALARVASACEQLTAGEAVVRYRGSMLLPEEETCFCWFESDRRERAAEANELARIPYARITAGVIITPGE